MVKDMQLARRIRGDRKIDYVDRMIKQGNEVFYSLPYKSLRSSEVLEESFSQTELVNQTYTSNIVRITNSALLRPE